jgi:hypothetical protein
MPRAFPLIPKFEERTTMSKRRQKSARSKPAAREAKAFQHQPEIRALTIYESLPPGYCTFRVKGDGSAPHLCQNEYAVIDTLDRDIQHGELYVIQHEGGRRSRWLAQARVDYLNITGPGAEDSLVWWMGDLRGFRRTDESFDGIPVFAGMSDGPYITEHLQSKLIGRVVGVAFSPLHPFLAESAGYENEDAGNAAFDPAEYIDVLIATGHRPYLFNDSYFEEMPDNALSDAQTNAVFAVRRKYCEASTALDRVMAECLKRGLVHGKRAA